MEIIIQDDLSGIDNIEVNVAWRGPFYAVGEITVKHEWPEEPDGD